MAVTKLWPVRSRLKYVIDYAEDKSKTTKEKNCFTKAEDPLKDVIAYAKNEEKTEQELFCDGINCNAKYARDQFVLIKEQFGKTDGIQAYHGYISFKEQNITPELAQKIGMEFANKVWGKRFQVVVTTHLNTQHLHCHFVINSVSFVDGKRLQNEEKAWFKFHLIADEICKKYELETIDTINRNPDSDYLSKKDLAGMPTRYNVARRALDDAISISTNQKELEYQLFKMGYKFDFNERHKYWTITIKDDIKPIRLYRLGEEYTQERIIERLIENQNKVNFLPFYYQKPQYKLPTRENKIKKVGGLYGLYLHYCYRLGALPKYKRQNPARVHYLFKEDLMKLDELTAQTTLLSKNHIGNTEELYIYKQTVVNEIENLSETRKHLRQEIRKNNISDVKLVEDRKEISIISEKLKNLRKEVKLCDGILERSENIKERIEKVITEEEKQKLKEVHKNERKR